MQLTAGDIAGARQSFAELANASTSAAPKIGYSLAAIAEGDSEAAAWAMRRAMDTDPQMVSHKLSRAELQPMLADMVNRLHADLSTNPGDSNKVYLVSQLDPYTKPAMTDPSMNKMNKFDESGASMGHDAEPSMAKPMMEPFESAPIELMRDNLLPPSPTIVPDTELPALPTQAF